MDPAKIIRRNKLAVILWISSVVLLYVSLFIFSRVGPPYFLDYAAGFFVGVIFLSAAYLAYASFRYRSSLSQLRRWLTLFPAALMLSLSCRMIYNLADYDYGVAWRGEGQIHGQFDFGFNTENFEARKLPGDLADWSMHNHHKLPDKIGVSWVGSDGIRHSQIVDLRDKLPFIQENMQILFIIFPDRVETKVAKRPALFPLP